MTRHAVTSFGPFSVSGAQIAGLPPAQFSQFVNRLLAAEAAAHGMTGTSLETTYLENVGDGGVDAGLKRATDTTWIPAGDSAWQFKSGDLGPAKCKKELEGATKAQAILRAGGHYRLVLGRSLNSKLVAARRDALTETARDLGIAVADYTIDVIAADGLARWVEQYPALAVDPLLGGIGHLGQTFEQWAGSNRHVSMWTSSESRERYIEDLRNVVAGDGQYDLHIEGASGLGKTRLVMEALRGQECEPLVVYAAAADQFSVAALTQMQGQNRTAVVVIDECDSKTHEIYASVLTASTSLRLITMGEPTASSTRSSMIGLTALEDDAMKKLLRQNESGLWTEATNVIVEIAGGNVDYALKASKAVVARDATSAGALITERDIRGFITAELPDGALFLGCCILALFNRVGFDGEVAHELTVVAKWLGLQERELREAARALEQNGLLSRQGRFRAVGPQPVALYLVSQAWLELGETIVRDLLPSLNLDMTERLFRRAAEIGDADTSRLAVERAMAPNGLLGSWESILEGENAKLLVHLAVLAPAVTAVHLDRLIESATHDELISYRSIRRDLVWTLEKLAWHSDTFASAADMLLRLAIAEIEDYGNNATGTWVDLFGTMLPGTAANPGARLEYLARNSESPDLRVRELVVRAADHALKFHESITVSGEVQGGVVVEPRGKPETYGEARQYQCAMMDLLRQLSDDSDDELASEALKALVGSIHPSLEVDTVREHLGGLLFTLDTARLRAARLEMTRLRSLFAKANVDDARVSGLNALEATLPSGLPADRLWELAHTNSWDWRDEDLAGAMGLAYDDLGEAADAANALLAMLQDEALPAAYEVGRTLARLASHTDAYLEPVSTQLEGPNGSAVVGYLWELTDHGDSDAFDTFIDDLTADPSIKLRLTVQGPPSNRAQRRVDDLVDSVTVHEAAGLMFRWLRNSDLSQLASRLEVWLPRIESQEDYNAVVDLVALQLHGKTTVPEILRVSLGRLVTLRRAFPSVGQQGRDWVHLAGHLMADDPLSVVLLLAELIEENALQVYEGSAELQLLQRGVREARMQGWKLLMDRIAEGSWRLNLSAQGWLGSEIDLESARTWVGDDLVRARVLSSVTSIGDEEVSDVGEYLLENYGSDDKVSSSLVGNFISGFWVGLESDRITSQIEQVRSWIEQPNQSQAVTRWARKLLTALEAKRMSALEREEELW